MLIRYREHKRWFRKPLLVLQVGFQRRVKIHVDYKPSLIDHPYWEDEVITIHWRDATPSELKELTRGEDLGELCSAYSSHATGI